MIIQLLLGIAIFLVNLSSYKFYMRPIKYLLFIQAL